MTFYVTSLVRLVILGTKIYASLVMHILARKYGIIIFAMNFVLTEPTIIIAYVHHVIRHVWHVIKTTHTSAQNATIIQKLLI